MTSIQKELHQAALQVRDHSHSPYSGFAVSAALKTKDGRLVTGVNIENASFGATVCAERVAIWKAVSERPGTRIQEIVVMTDQEKPWPPCGLCRQVMAEFCDPTTLIHLGNLKGILQTMSFESLMPFSFTPEHLHRRSPSK